MTAQHTPGPWEWSAPDYEAEHDPPNSCASDNLYGPNQAPVLSGCVSCGNIFYNEANGRLIAAAPELLAALENAKRYVGLVRTSDVDGDDQIFGVMDDIDAAIAKARAQS